MRGTRLHLCLAAALGIAGCKSETGTVLEITSTPAFEPDCTLAATPTKFQSVGSYDPAGGTAFIMPLQLVNLANKNQNPAAIPGDPNIKPTANDAIIVGYDFCFYRADISGATNYDPSGTGLPVDCDNVPSGQRGFLPSSGTVPSDGGTLTTAVLALDITLLRVLFGDAFTPFAIPQGDNPFDLVTRSPNWGDFPADSVSLVNINVRARAKHQSGGTVRSNWYSFPVLVEPTGIRDACQATLQACPSGTPALQGSKTPDTACSQRFSGAVFECEAVDQCS